MAAAVAAADTDRAAGEAAVSTPPSVSGHDCKTGLPLRV